MVIVNLYMKAFNKCTIVALLLISSVFTSAQQLPDTLLPAVNKPVLGPYDTITVPGKIIDNQLYPAQTLEWAWVSTPMPEAMRKRKAEWTRLRNAVYVTYPYAKKAGGIMNEINVKTATMSERDKKKYIKSREKELKKEFAEPLTNLSVYQGKVLMKLINRQTGNNCYAIIKEYKGGFTARMYQTVAFFFNSSLKQEYDASEGDKEIETIVQEVERMYR
jgi:Domain of unknown function (DUF4294)